MFAFASNSRRVCWRRSRVPGGHPFPSTPHPRGLSSARMADKLATLRGVICLPGSYFGAQDGYLRFAFANADVPTIALLKDRLARFTLD